MTVMAIRLGSHCSMLTASIILAPKKIAIAHCGYDYALTDVQRPTVWDTEGKEGTDACVN